MTAREWLTDRDGVDWPRAFLLALAVTTVLALGVVAATSTTAFGPYNPSWDGSTDLHDGLEDDPDVSAEIVRETDRYDDLDAENATAFVVAPEEPYEGTDAERVRSFVDRGGTLVVLENFDDGGNRLLAAVGAEARTDGGLLRDDRHNYRGPAMPVATGVENHTRTEGVDQLTLNYATAVEPGNATVLVSTSDFAYLGDADTDLSETEDLSAHPVATTEPVGDGEVVVVGDPSITINVMLEQPDNRAFLENFADDRVLFDLSHAGDVPPLAAAALTLRELPLLQALVGGLGVGLAALAARGVPPTVRRRLPARWRRREHREPGLTDGERRALVADRHPEWDDDRVDRVIAAFNRSGEKRRDDE
ncbi:DUF4350 domain-containing protein [Natrononativus amylolyticus]|uniref:DUF4350 domain-containing protein n=1 Tax=Natrononativus amylolyticus TaxID=2963434 RepID=UPI0020CCFF5E|nr:DUF4350 domain-containing protein [Natrononativus amylolyticus]